MSDSPKPDLDPEAVEAAARALWQLNVAASDPRNPAPRPIESRHEFLSYARAALQASGYPERVEQLRRLADELAEELMAWVGDRPDYAAARVLTRYREATK